MGNRKRLSLLAVCVINSSKGRSSDLIIMAMKGHQGFLDSPCRDTTEKFLRQASYPVFAVPVGERMV